ncbi:hypothetical protein KBX53_20640 [Micromonospora sp. M51]|uniref:hypothetical protein n=1 Tax=Micromonospora TaxID=1873 RepID=UPI0004BF64FF|nr:MULTISPECIES: hypothetical protein [Micromonospora]MBQ1013316.1 hypothetical protein [Micromonospora sp. M51]MBQ1031541.1 hypothetical protein [Micromonospora sp. C97]
MIRNEITAELEAPDRLFQITHVSRTHTQLWLQADASSTHEYRLEVLFQDVTYLCTPFVLRGLSLRRAHPEQTRRLTGLHELAVEPGWGVYLLSRSHDWFVVSSSPLWAEAKLSYSAEPVFWSYTGKEDIVVSMGTVK